MRRAFLSLANACERATAALLIALMGMMVILGAWQVLSRFVVHEPSPWTEEVLRRAMIWLVALGLSIGFRHGAHISVEVIRRVRIAWVRTLVYRTVFCITAVFLVILAWLGADMAWRVRFQTFASMDIAMTWAYLAIPVGAALAFLALVASALSFSPEGQTGDDTGALQCQA